MLWAVGEDGNRIAPSPGARATCPGCQGDVLAKCGQINIWHWSHINADCDPWSEPESEWHREWKSHFPVDLQEVEFADDEGGVIHRADVAYYRFGTIEFQRSSISIQEIYERECFYVLNTGVITWVIDASEFVDRLSLSFDKNGFVRIHWQHARKSWADDRGDKRIRRLFDLGNGILLYVKKLSSGYDARGWGYLITKRQFLDLHQERITSHSSSTIVDIDWAMRR